MDDDIESPPNTYFATSVDYQSPEVEQIDWLKEWHKTKTSINEAIQREIYLMEEIHLIKKEEKTPSDSGLRSCLILDLSPSWFMSTVNKDLPPPAPPHSTISAMSSTAPARKFIFGIRRFIGFMSTSQWGGISIGRYFEEADCEDLWCDEVNTGCIIRRGCCARECGCCGRARKTKVGPKSQRGGKWTHCTESCGCCIRWRGFYKTDPSLEKEKESGRS